jgi:hypothetical protein
MDSTKTIPNSYKLIKMETEPGIFEEILHEKVLCSNGKMIYVPVEYRLAQAAEQDEFDKRFNNTVTRPNDWKPETTSPIVQVKPSKVDKIDAHLTEALGDPKRIVEQHGIDETKKHNLKNRSHVATFIELIKITNKKEWNEALPFVRAYYLTLGN